MKITDLFNATNLLIPSNQMLDWFSATPTKRKADLHTANLHWKFKKLTSTNKFEQGFHTCYSTGSCSGDWRGMRSVAGRKMWWPNSHSAANSDLWIPFQTQLSCSHNNILQDGHCLANRICRFLIGILSLQLNCSYANYDIFLCACGTLFQNMLQHFFPLTYKETEGKKTDEKFKLNSISVLATWVDFVQQIPNGHLPFIDSY